MVFNWFRGIKSCLNPLFSANLSNIPNSESSMLENRESYNEWSYTWCEKMSPTNDGFKKNNFIVNIRKSDISISEFDHRKDITKMKRPIYCVFDDKNTTSLSHSGLFLSSLAIV